MDCQNLSPVAVVALGNRVARWREMFASLVLMMLLVGCGKSTSSAPVLILDDPQGSEPTPDILLKLANATDLIAPLPSVSHTQTMAATGLQISYTSESLRRVAPPLTIEKQWVFMQQCVQQFSAAPVVLVRQGPVVPITVADDVVRNENPMSLEITSTPIASASVLHGPLIQVSTADFDGSLGTAGFNLRSIMGRHLWLSANLPERDYPFECARQLP